MKGATDCAKRFKGLVRSLRAKSGKPPALPAGDPVEQLFMGIFTRDVPEHKARDAYDRLRALVVDFNELRVIPSLELTEALGDYPDARHKCEDLSRALNRIFWIEHAVSLERLRKGTRKDVAGYLDRIDGLEPYTRARIRLLGLGQNAFPLDEAMLGFLRREEIVDPKATLDETQSFIERQMGDDEYLEIFGLLKRHAWSEMERAVRKGEVEKIKSVPPDRTTRNMLRAVAEAADHDQMEADPDLSELPEGELPDMPGMESEPELVESVAEAGSSRKGKKDARGGKSRPSGPAKPGKKKAPPPAARPKGKPLKAK